MTFFSDMPGFDFPFGRHYLPYGGPNSSFSKRNPSSTRTSDCIHVWSHGQSGLHHDARKSL